MHASTFKRFHLLFVAFLCVLVFGCASTTSREGAGEYVDDSVITTKVKYAIAQDPELKVMEINVETFKGRVQLSGFVSSRANMRHATDVAASVKGVKSVINDLRLK